MTYYADNLTLREARDRYAGETGFGQASYRERWVKLELGPFPFLFPNTKGRRRALPYHDLHHILTGYGTTMAGEAEIGAWELGSGCRHFPTAWVLDLLAAATGLAFCPQRVVRAFQRGRKCENLYGRILDESLMEKTLGEVRIELFLSFAAGQWVNT